MWVSPFVMLLSTLGVVVVICLKLLKTTEPDIPDDSQEEIKINVAVVSGNAYWQFKGDWFMAPMLNAEPDGEKAHRIDLDKAPPEQLYLLMRILETFKT